MQDDDVRIVVGSAALGAILGALAGVVYLRTSRAPRRPNISVGDQLMAVDKRRLAQLGMAVIGVVRMLVELGHE